MNTAVKALARRFRLRRLWRVPNVVLGLGLITTGLLQPAVALAAQSCPATRTSPATEIVRPELGFSCGEECRPAYNAAVAGSAEKTFEINRVVGPGFYPYLISIPGRSGGYLAQSILNDSSVRVVSRHARLRVERFSGSSWGRGHGDMELTLELNGWPIGNVKFTPGRNWTSTECFEFPVEKLLFAQRQAAGTPPRPGENVLRARASGTGCNQCSISIKLMELSFEALPPIVLMHGFNTSLAGWSSTAFQHPGGPERQFFCQDDSENFFHSREPFVEGEFIRPLLDHGIPFDCVYAGVSSDLSVTNGGNRLAAQLPLIARSFGTRFVNVIAHSKGGLWTRHAITEMGRLPASERVGILNVVSLDTPHHGSALAPLMVAGLDAVVRALQLTGEWNMQLQVSTAVVVRAIQLNGGYDDLTPAALRTFNQFNVRALSWAMQRNRVVIRRQASPGSPSWLDDVSFATSYQTLASDPDRNNNGVLEPPPVSNEHSGPLSDALWDRVYRTLRSAEYFIITPYPMRMGRQEPRLPLRNDLIVHVHSQLGTPYSVGMRVLPIVPLTAQTMPHSHMTATKRCRDCGDLSSVTIAVGAVMRSSGSVFECHIQ